MNLLALIDRDRYKGVPPYSFYGLLSVFEYRYVFNYTTVWRGSYAAREIYKQMAIRCQSVPGLLAQTIVFNFT